MKNIILTGLCLILIASTSFAQVAINNDGAKPDASAMLEVTSIDKGVLIPRMNSKQRMGIPVPATGLMVFDTDYNAFWFFNGDEWMELGRSQGGSESAVSPLEYLSSSKLVRGDENVIDPNSDFLFGWPSLEATWGTSGCSRMLFDKGKGAFRAGLGYENWDQSELGSYSIGLGYNPKAKGHASLAFGNNVEATNQWSIAMGVWSKAPGYGSISMGWYTEPQGKAAMALGYDTKAPSYREIAIGSKNTNYTPNSSTSWNANDRLFSIGNGNNSRSDALVMLKSGNTTLNGDLDLNGALTLNNDYTFPSSDGNNNQILSTNGNGQLSWVNAPIVEDDQTLSLVGNNLSISEGNSVNLSNIDTDDQTLIFTGTSLSIADGNTVSLSVLKDNMGNHTATSNIKLSGKWLSNDGGNEGVYVATNGNVGIGTTSTSKAKLTIGGGVNSSTAMSGQGQYGNFGPNGNGGTSGQDSRNVAIWATKGFVAERFMAISDKRVKNIEGISDGKEDLETLMDIEITDYSYIDYIEKGNTPQKKVIAQQVAEVFPQAVKTNNLEVIPDIMKNATVNEGWIAMENDLKKGDRVRIISETFAEIVEVKTAEATRFQIELPSEIHDLPATVFVYGREVNDFHVVDYEAISMLNVSATQQLAKENAMLIAENEDIKAELAALKDLKSQMAELKAMTMMLKAQVEEQTNSQSTVTTNN